MYETTSGVFFHHLATAALRADPFDFDVLRQQFSPSPCDGINVETEKYGEASVAAASGFECFEPGIQAPLLLVEHAEEQDDGRP